MFKKAFTLVELIAAMVLIGVVFLGITTLFLSGQKSFTNVLRQAVEQHKVNLIMEYVIKDLRKIAVRKGKGIDLNATFGTSVKNKDIAFNGLITDYLDIDGSDNETNGDEKYRYWFDGANIIRSAQIYNSGSGGWPSSWSDEIIVSGISGLEFRYCTSIIDECKIQGGVQVKMDSITDDKNYIFKIPYSF